MQMTKEEAMAALRSSHEELMSHLDAFPIDKWATPMPSGSWRVRDVAAHIAAWDRILAADMRALEEGQVPAWLAWDDATTDAVNESHVSERAGWSIQQLRDELRMGRDELIDAVSKLGEPRFATIRRAGDVEASPVGLCEYWIRHDRAHTAEISLVAVGDGAM